MQPTFPPFPPPPPPYGEPPVGQQPQGMVGQQPPSADESQAQRARPVRESKAVAAFTLGVLCLVGTVCGMGLSLGVPAIVLGALAHREIRRGGGVATGGGLATAGIILGSVGSTIFVGWVGIVAFTMFWPSSNTDSRTAAPPSMVAPAAEGSTSRAPRGSILQLHSAAGALRAQLVNQALSAARAGEDVLVETSVASCEPCGEIESAVADPAVLAALSKVRLVRVDVGEFRSELAGLRMNEPTVPWFYLLDGRGQPRDAISADEWDDNDAENIAPVLGAFVHGKLQPRRTSWRGRTSL